ncbi:hypothetical protein [Paenibacillus sp. MMO-58]|uniref:hypothetical protein n=1 Tax=Paenibacillus sp. MMO-58 TaxID=3081290 RepID=UPI0030188E31
MPGQVHDSTINSVLSYLAANLGSIAVASGAQPAAGAASLSGEMARKDTAAVIAGNQLTKTTIFSEAEGNGAIRSIGLIGDAGLISSDAIINKTASQSLTVAVTIEVHRA